MMSGDITNPEANEFTERVWRLIEKHMGCRVPLYVKNILKLRGFDNATSIKTLSDEDYKAFETFARTKMDKFIPSTSNREDYYHIFSKEPCAFEILPGHIRLLNEIAKYITIMTASHDPTFFDPDSYFRNGDNSIGQSQESFKSNEKVDCELANSDNHSNERGQPLKSNESNNFINDVIDSIGRSQQLLRSNEKVGYELKNSVKKSIGRSQQLFPNKNYELRNSINDSIGRNQKLHEDFVYSTHNLLRRTQSNNLDCGRKQYYNFAPLQQRQGECEIIQALLLNSTKLDSYRSGENCYVSHVNSLSDFYIQMESDGAALKKLAQYLVDAPQFDVLTDIKEGVVCAAKFMDDGLWYRAKILSPIANNAGVFFIDFGKTSLTNELRILPPAISSAPSLAKHCTMVEPKDVQCWVANAEERFLELSDNKTHFMVEVISPGSKSIVNLFVNQKSFLEEVACLSAKHSSSVPQTALQSTSDAVVPSNRVKVLIIDGKPSQFYVQLESNLNTLNQLWKSLQSASTWPKLEEVVVGRLCAAFFEDSFYRATILSLHDEGANVHYVDYGNTSISTDLRQLPDNLHDIQPIAILCCLKTENGIYTQQLVDRFENLSREELFEMRYVSENSIPAIVELFENLEQIMDKPEIIPELNGTTDAEKMSSTMKETYKPKISYTVRELKQIFANMKALKEAELNNRPNHESTTLNTDHREYKGSCGDCLTRVGDSAIKVDSDCCKYQQMQSYCIQRDRERDTLAPEGVIDPNTQIPFEEISINNTEEVTLSWFYSPLEFYVSTTKNETDFTMEMKKINHFYKNKSPIDKKVEIGSFVIVKYRQDNRFYRAEIIDYNEEFNKYKALILDFGILMILDPTNVYEMDKCFAKFKRHAILCSLRGVALRTSRLDIENAVEKYFAEKKLTCKFIERMGQKYYVDLEVDGINVKADLIENGYLSVLSEDIEIERLVGQIVMAKIVSIKDWRSLQLIIFGCETIFEASCKDFKLYSEFRQLEELPMQVTIPVRINSLLIGRIFCVTPLISTFGGVPSSICRLPFFSTNLKVLVTHWESLSVAYVQCVNADTFEQSILTELFGYYNSDGEVLQEFFAETTCAVKSADENWYRAQIISETESEVKVRYLDYGNCERIPKRFVKRLESQFLETPALANKVHLLLKEAGNNNEMLLDEIDTYTSHISLDLTIHTYHDQNWIVDMFKDGTNITSFIKTTTCCETLTVDELKEQLDNIKIAGNVAREYESTKMLAYISHVERPDRFYLVTSTSGDLELEVLQENIQIVAPSLPPLEDFSTDTRCIVRYSVDGQWYRAVIIDSDTKITSILFMDYGNMDTITDNALIKSMNESFDQIPAYAIPCALPIEPKDRNEWSEESCQLLKDLVNDEVEFEYVCKGKANNFVKLYQGERDIMQELMQIGYAIKLDTIGSGENCYVSHVNSISDFYIQMESDTDALEKLVDYLLDESKFEILADVKDGVVCVAKFIDDGLWYRAKIKSHTANNTEVLFIDYGSSSLTNELRIIPPEIADAPSLAKHCSMVKPKDIQYWSENAEQRFMELNDSGIVFVVDVASPGKKSIVDLFVNGKSVLEEISSECKKDSLTSHILLNTSQNLQQSYEIPSETFKALIVDGTPGLFYIQLERNLSELYQLWELLKPAVEWPVLDEVFVGQMCAALYDADYYRAKILSVNDEGVTVHYVDYGNKSISIDLRVLPEDLQISEPLAIKCALESKNGIYSAELVKRFENLSRDDLFEMKYVTEDSCPVVIQLFENGVLFADETTEISEPTRDTLIKAYITAIISPNHFYIQLNNDMEEAMSSAAEFPLLEDGDKCAGNLCAAFWEEAFYRAQILSVDEKGIKVHFIDYGNESYVTDLRKLPQQLEKIERASMLCTLESDKEEFSNEFCSLDLDKPYEFEIVHPSSPCVVRLYDNGKLFLDDIELKQENDHVQTDKNNSIVEEIINEAIEKAENLFYAN